MTTQGLSVQDKQRFGACYAAFALNGVLALSIGTLLPYLRAAYGLDYAFAGLVVSLHSVGNLFSSFAAGVLPLTLGRRKSALVFSACYALAFVLVLLGAHALVLAVAFFMTGLARGACSNFCNVVVNEIATGKAWALNVLHACFAVGALCAPLLVVLFAEKLGSWRAMCLLLVAFGVLQFLLYAAIPIPNDRVQRAGSGARGDLSILKSRPFWVATGTLFFYLCTEQGVIGWMVTYFQDSGIMPAALAQTMASVLWVLILLGRLTTAWLSNRMDQPLLLVFMGFGMVGCFALMMLSGTLPLIVAGIAGFGFCMAGVYPTTVSLSGQTIKKVPLAWSFMLTLASFGSVLMPSVIGAVAEAAGIRMGMGTIVFSVAVTLGFILANYRQYHKK